MTTKTLKKIISLGGATIDKNGSQKNFARGWQVSKKDLFILQIDNNNIKNILQVINKELKNISKNEFLGLWVDSQKIYIDLSIKINNKKTAFEIGKKNNQLSIFNWYNKKCYFLGVA